MAMCKECKLTIDDLEYMTIGNAIDYISTYVDMKSEGSEKNSGVREATQADFDNF